MGKVIDIMSRLVGGGTNTPQPPEEEKGMAIVVFGASRTGACVFSGLGMDPSAPLQECYDGGYQPVHITLIGFSVLGGVKVFTEQSLIPEEILADMKRSSGIEDTPEVPEDTPQGFGFNLTPKEPAND